MKHPTKENLIDYYYFGYYSSKDNKPFPNWFEFHSEKMVCLEGYNDASLEVVKDNTEVEEFIKKLGIVK